MFKRNLHTSGAVRIHFPPPEAKSQIQDRPSPARSSQVFLVTLTPVPQEPLPASPDWSAQGSEAGIILVIVVIPTLFLHPTMLLSLLSWDKNFPWNGVGS